MTGIVTTAFIVGLSGAMSPGPLTLVTMVRAAREGVKGGMKVCLGHGLVEILVVIALGLGAGTILSRSGLAGTFALVGSVVLGIMGLSLMKEANADSPDMIAVSASRQEDELGPVAAGIAATVGNPYWIMWWATIGVSYATLANRYGAPGLILFFGGHYMADVVTLGAVSIAMAQGRRWLSAELYRRLLLLFGVLLWIIAAYFLYSAWNMRQ